MEHPEAHRLAVDLRIVLPGIPSANLMPATLHVRTTLISTAAPIGPELEAAVLRRLLPLIRARLDGLGR